MSVDDDHLTDLEQQLLEDVSELERRVDDLEQLVEEKTKKRLISPTDVHDNPASYDPSTSGSIREDDRERSQVRVKQYIEQLEPPDATATPVDLVKEALRADGYDDAEIEHELDRLRRYGEIYTLDDDRLRVV